MKKAYITISVSMLFFYVVNSQDSTKSIIAKKGDGIISVLRNNGINVTKYYERFLQMNKGNIRNGSELHLGRTYYLPHAPDSFKNMGRYLSLPGAAETPIFSKELRAIRKKDGSLDNTVYYMLLGASNALGSTLPHTSNELAKNMAKELLSHGAKVYLVNNKGNNNASLGEYTEAINRLYLKNNGTYQRLLVLNINTDKKSDLAEITIAHHDKSPQGKKMASHIGKVFRERHILKRSSKEHTNVFTDKTNLYLAKNMLPQMTYIGINVKTPLKNDVKDLKKRDIDFADLIANGILQDYTSLDFEDEN